MWAIGKIIRRMGLEYSIMKMGINIREGGVRTRDMGKVHFGYVILRINLGGSTRVIGKLIRKKEEGLCSSNLEIVMMECGWIANLMEREE
jgi:hypothetical protein